jgi:hypothetical protein
MGKLSNTKQRSVNVDHIDDSEQLLAERDKYPVCMNLQQNTLSSLFLKDTHFLCLPWQQLEAQLLPYQMPMHILSTHKSSVDLLQKSLTIPSAVITIHCRVI